MRLDFIQNQALRICCGAFKTSSVPAIQEEMRELLLELRRIQLMANYWAGLQGHNDSHPTKAVLQDCWENGKNLKENFGRIGNNVAKELDVFNLRISPMVVFPEMAPWKMTWPETGMCLRRKEKLRKKLMWKTYLTIEIYTDKYRFIQTVLKDQRLKRPGLGWQFQGKK